MAYTQRVVPIEGTENYQLITIVMAADQERVMDMRPMVFRADPQDNGSYETYNRRYALLTVFGLAPEDDDGERAKPRKKAGQEPRKPRNKQKQEPIDPELEPVKAEARELMEECANLGIAPKGITAWATAKFGHGWEFMTTAEWMTAREYMAKLRDDARAIREKKEEGK